MLGVVLWSDAAKRKAVIWCEDQGDLAYFKPQDSALQAEQFFDAGDLVQFDLVNCSSIRRASNTKLVAAQGGSSLPHVLRAPQADAEAGQVSRVIPFERPKATGEPQFGRSAASEHSVVTG
ncbi:MAG: hypothetical protein AAGI36_01720 [Pseudomonadota bacterium]